MPNIHNKYLHLRENNCHFDRLSVYEYSRILISKALKWRLKTAGKTPTKKELQLNSCETVFPFSIRK